MTTDESTSGNRAMERKTTGEDRVRISALQMSEPRTVDWIASVADCSHRRTIRVLEQLVADGTLKRDDSGTERTYYPDYRRQAIREAIRLRDSGDTIEELTDRLTEMKDQIRDWRDEFDVESPNELRGTIANEAVDTEEEDRRHEIARDWEQLKRRIRIVGFTVREWDFLTSPTEPAETNR